MSEEQKKSTEQDTPESEEKKTEEKKSDADVIYDNDDNKSAEEKKEDDSKESDDEKSDGKKDDSNEDEKSDDKKESEDEKQKDEDYNLESPENSLISKERVDEISAYAKEKGLSKEVAQEIVNRENEAVSQYAENAKSELNRLADEEWPKQAQEDKEIGGEKFQENVENAKRAFKHFGSEEFNEIMETTGYGNHPEVIRIFSRIGKAMSNDSLVTGQTGTTEKKSTAELLYGDTSKKS